MGTTAHSGPIVNPILRSERTANAAAAMQGGEAAAVAATAAPSAMQRLMYWPGIYMELGKVRLSTLVVGSTASGYYMGAAAFDPSVFGVTMSGTMLAAMSANTINQWYEVANDSKMGRTLKRPLPSGRISPGHALAVGVGSGAVGSTMLATAINPLAGGIAASNILLYTMAYTPMKVVHPINTWIGAVVGGLPPLIGYAAATGSLDPTAGLLGAMLFSWQFPHFMALAHYCKKDYLAGGYQMLSDKRAAGVALRHSLFLMPMGVAAPMMGITTWMFGAESLLISGYMAYHAAQFYRNPAIRTAKQLFRTSLWHLPLLLALMAVHKIDREEMPDEATDAVAADGEPNKFLGMVDLSCTRYAISEIANGPGK